MNFWGPATNQPKAPDVARFLETIRSLTEKHPPERKLKLATSALHAIAAFVVKEFGPKELISLLDEIREGITGT